MTSHKAVKVFESHTKHDSDFCDIFDRACARVGIDAFRSEYESIDLPAWKTIKEELGQSKALFLLIGKALVSMQSSHEQDWEYTQNWISYEIGIACSLGIDVWVLCDGVRINFPVPYFRNYFPYSFRLENNFRAMVNILETYSEGLSFGELQRGRKVICSNTECRIPFNLFAKVKKGETITCPCCLQDITFHEDFRLS